MAAIAHAQAAPGAATGRLDVRLGDPGVARYRERVRAAVTEILPLQAEAEAGRSFPRAALAILGRAGLLRERWAGGGHGDLARSLVLSEELGYAGLGGIGIGVSLHLEAVLAILTRFGRSEPLQRACAGALDGRLVGCLATSERHAGSDLTSVSAALRSVEGGWRLSGAKWFVSPGAAADFALVLCRRANGPADAGGRRAPLALAYVPRGDLSVRHTLQTVGMRSLGTARIDVDAHIAPDALVARPGAGLATVTWGLVHERLAVGAQALGTARLAIALAATHMRRRTQFGVTLFEHQALRLRLAELAARVDLARRGVWSLADELPALREHGLRATAAAKATATRLAAHVIDETMHLFGGAGYVETETPLGRMWRDSRIGRLGAGSDEVMWELVAGRLRGDEESYERLVSLEQ